jgi:protein-L-isoaspartate(D-aspartate) O-methyltransferase
MLVPVGSLESQRLMMVTRTQEGYSEEVVLECTFVPLLGRFGWRDDGRVDG